MTAVGGPPSSLTKISPDSNVVVAGATLSITARLTDKFGNPSPGVPVTWTATSGTLSKTTTTTTTSGNAEVNFVTTPTAGAYFVTATVAGVGSVTFKVVGL